MNYQGDVAKALVDEILELVYRYDESILTVTAIGCLEMAKLQILYDQVQEREREEKE